MNIIQDVFLATKNMTKEKSKIFIGLPSNRGFLPQTFECLAEMIEFSKHKNLDIVVSEHGYTVAENRNYIAVQACNNGSDYVLMIDDDMTFKDDILDRLLDNNKDICGVAYHGRGGNDVINAKIGDKILKDEDVKGKKDLMKVSTVGTGVILIKTDVFRKMTQPWFAFKTYDNGACEQGEDWYFCEKAKKYNINTYIDPKPKIGHLGEITIL